MKRNITHTHVGRIAYPLNGRLGARRPYLRELWWVKVGVESGAKLWSKLKPPSSAQEANSGKSTDTFHCTFAQSWIDTL